MRITNYIKYERRFLERRFSESLKVFIFPWQTKLELELTHGVSTNRRRSESLLKASYPEVVTPQDNLLESLVVEEHVDGAGVGHLPGVVLLVLHAAFSLIDAGIILSGAKAGDEVSSRDKPVRQLVEHLQVDGHGVGGAGHGAVGRHHVPVDVVGVLQGGVQVLQLTGVHREGVHHAFIEVLMDSVVKIAGVALTVVVHEELLRQDVPGDIGVQVPVLPHQLRDDVDVNTGVEVFQFLGEAEMSPDNCHVGIASEEGVPHLQMLDFLEVSLRVVAAVEESPVVRPQEVFPPEVLALGQLQLVRGNKTT